MNTNGLINLVACSFLLTVAIGGRSQPLTVSTLAGNGAPGSTNGQGSSAQFRHPNGAATDAEGNVYVADTENSTIRMITPDGTVSTFAGSPGNAGSLNGPATNALFYGPQGIAVDNAGVVYIADTANAMLRKISPAGTVTTLAGSAGFTNSLDGSGTNALFFHPEALAVDGAGNVYVADTWNHTIRKITPAGTVTTLAGLAGNPGSADGTNSKARFNWPAGIALDSATNLYVSDFLNHTIRKITPAGAVTTIAGLPGVWGSTDGTNSTARFYMPQGIVADSTGALFVADSGNQAIRKLSGSGTNWVVTTVGGSLGSPGNANGLGNTAQFFFPAGIALDGEGELYLADSGNNTIRSGLFVPPTLEFLVSGSQLILSWPVAAGGFLLETTSVLLTGAQWTTLTNGLSSAGDRFVSTNQLAGSSAFYRLRKQ